MTTKNKGKECECDMPRVKYGMLVDDCLTCGKRYCLLKRKENHNQSVPQEGERTYCCEVQAMKGFCSGHVPPPPPGEKIEIVPSARIDYCVDCDKDHGYECPAPLGGVEDWVKQFEEKFPHLADENVTVIAKSPDDEAKARIMTELMRFNVRELKDFIRTLLTHSLTTYRDKVLEIIERIEVKSMHDVKPEVREFAEHFVNETKLALKEKI